MTKENQKIYFLALFMVICAIFLRVIGKLGVLSVHGGIIRSLLYITLYIRLGHLCLQKNPPDTGTPLYACGFVLVRFLVCHTVNEILPCDKCYFCAIYLVFVLFADAFYSAFCGIYFYVPW